MFSLIIVIVSIALVAVLALATIYYGGSTTQEAQARARASTVINQGQQLLAASEIFYNTNRRWPTNMEELVSTSHLKTIPSPPGEMGAWTQPVSGQPTYTVSVPVDESLCRAVNKQARGDDGILTQAYRTLVTQCYGTNATTLTVVVTKNGATLDATVPAGDIGSGTVPTDPADAGWLVPPGTSSTPGGTAPNGLRLVGPWPVSVSAMPYGPVDLGWNTSPGLPMTTTVGSTTTETVTVTNIATDPVAYGVSWLSTSNSPALTLSNNTCGSFVNPGDSCSVDVTYAPTAAQTGVAHLVVSPAFTNTNGGIITAPLPNESVSVTVRYSSTAAAPQTTIKVVVTSGVGTAYFGNYMYFDVTRMAGAPLSAINIPDPSFVNPEAAQSGLVVFAGPVVAFQNYGSGYSAVDVQEGTTYLPLEGKDWGSTVRFYAPNFGGSSVSSSIGAGPFSFVISQYVRGDSIIEMTLPSDGSDVQSWCVDLERPSYSTYKWEMTNVTSGPCW